MKEIIQAKIKTINSINGNINLEINSNKPTYFETEVILSYFLSYFLLFSFLILLFYFLDF